MTQRDRLRSMLATKLNMLFCREVPEYERLTQLVRAVNKEVLEERGDPAASDPARVSAMSVQRHGAIRVASGKELSWLRRLFSLYGMYPVDFYDLAPAGLPIHATAFRPTSTDAINGSPFRIFCSLLRTDLIDDRSLRNFVTQRIDERDMISGKLKRLIESAEETGDIDDADVAQFVAETVELFRWQGCAQVSQQDYERLLSGHKLFADILAFPGPHLNHLTPAVLDIDRAHQRMIELRFTTKAVIEGPPPRACPVLLRQTAFNAISEAFTYPGEADASGAHTARFGEIEARGAALTEAGRHLYDRCLEHALHSVAAHNIPYQNALSEAFSSFPDDWTTLIAQDLVYARYSLPANGEKSTLAPLGPDHPEARASAVDRQQLVAEPLTYEDFLPVSAAGIFRSNLGDSDSGFSAVQACREEFIAALGGPIIDSHQLYSNEQAESLKQLASSVETRTR